MKRIKLIRVLLFTLIALFPSSIFGEVTVRPEIAGYEVVRGSIVLDVNTTQFSSPADTAENIAISYTLPANILSADGKIVRATAFGTYGANANAKYLKMLVNNNTRVEIDSSGNGSSWKMEIEIIRTGIGTQKTRGSAVADSEAVRVAYANAVMDETTDLDIEVAAQNDVANAGDIIVEGMVVELLN